MYKNQHNSFILSPLVPTFGSLTTEGLDFHVDIYYQWLHAALMQNHTKNDRNLPHYFPYLFLPYVDIKSTMLLHKIMLDMFN